MSVNFGNGCNLAVKGRDCSPGLASLGDEDGVCACRRLVESEHTVAKPFLDQLMERGRKGGLSPAGRQHGDPGKYFRENRRGQAKLALCLLVEPASHGQ